MLFILGLLLMWCEYYHNLRYDESDGYLVIGILGRVMCTVSVVHFAWFVLL